MKTVTHRINLDLPVDEAFPLFTPRGEESWVPGWQPRYLHPANGDTEKGMVFTTGQGGEQTIWTCLDFDPKDRHARYFRAVPGSRIALVDVTCSANGRSSDVTVTYSHIALSDEGQAMIDAISDHSHAKDIEQWKSLIENRLSGSIRQAS